MPTEAFLTGVRYPIMPALNERLGLSPSSATTVFPPIATLLVIASGKYILCSRDSSTLKSATCLLTALRC